MQFNEKYIFIDEDQDFSATGQSPFTIQLTPNVGLSPTIKIGWYVKQTFKPSTGTLRLLLISYASEKEAKAGTPAVRQQVLFDSEENGQISLGALTEGYYGTVFLDQEFKDEWLRVKVEPTGYTSGKILVGLVKASEVHIDHAYVGRNPAIAV